MRSGSSSTVRDEPTFTEAARRAQIIDCAIDAIAELGFGRASLAEIAKRARVSKSVISYYFAGKDQLIAQVVQAIYAAGTAFMLPRIDAADTVAGALRALITSNVEFIGAHQRQIRAIGEIVANWRADDGSPHFDNALQDSSVRDIAALLRAGQKDGEFCAFAPEVMATSIRASIDALSMRLQIGAAVDIAGYGEEIAGLYERATAAPKRAPAQTKQPRRDARTGGTFSSGNKKEGRHA